MFVLKEGRAKLHDKVPSGRPSLVMDDLKEGKSPDLASSDCHLFLFLKTSLAGQILNSDQETKRTLCELAEMLGGDIFRIRNSKLSPTI